MVWRSDGKAWEARFLAQDRIDDLAAVQIADPGPIPKVDYADWQPRFATLIGFPHGGNVALAKTGGVLEAASVSYAFPAEQGVSGGPLFVRGKLALAGVLWGSTDQDCRLTSIRDCRRFLMQEACIRFFSRGPITYNYGSPAAPPPSVLPEPIVVPAPAPVPVAPPSTSPIFPVPVPVLPHPVPVPTTTPTPAPTVVEGPAGKDGKAGKDGINGTNGKDGSTPDLTAINVALVAIQKALLKPITFNVTQPDGTVATASARLGDTVNLTPIVTNPVLNPPAATGK